MNKTRLLITMAVFVAIGVVGAQFLWFPAGIAKAYPVQHAVNVVSAVTLGPGPAIIIAFMIGLVRNLLGLGTLLAFPGGIFGAMIAGVFYQKFKSRRLAAIGEILGTGIIASLFCVPFANWIMGSAHGIFFFLPSFLVSSISGALIGVLVLRRMEVRKFIQYRSY